MNVPLSVPENAAGQATTKQCRRSTHDVIVSGRSVGRHSAPLLAQCPELVPEDILAALAYGAEMAREKILPAAQ